ncbi:hypothetical protein JX266_011791 [Neoarthrinium moseri]|nr:hypothetical protein JX266_011791 [Neoarthrinium moseri]
MSQTHLDFSSDGGDDECSTARSPPRFTPTNASSPETDFISPLPTKQPNNSISDTTAHQSTPQVESAPQETIDDDDDDDDGDPSTAVWHSTCSMKSGTKSHHSIIATDGRPLPDIDWSTNLSGIDLSRPSPELNMARVLAGPQLIAHINTLPFPERKNFVKNQLSSHKLNEFVATFSPLEEQGYRRLGLIPGELPQRANPKSGWPMPQCSTGEQGPSLLQPGRLDVKDPVVASHRILDAMDSSIAT